MLIVLVACWASSVAVGYAQHRKTINFNEGWSFRLDSVSDYRDHRLDFSDWRRLDLPHDWSIELPFDSLSPGNSGAGYLSGGIGWYKKSFSLPAEERHRRIYIEFGGIYENNEVWINDIYLGKRPNGYIPIVYDLTDYVSKEGEVNTITVKVNNKQPNSRFYAGSGIYRDVNLFFTGEIAVVHNGTFITTPTIQKKRAEVKVQIELTNHSGVKKKNITIETQLHDPNGRIVATQHTQNEALVSGVVHQLVQNMEIQNPELWSIEKPYLYHAVTILRDGNGELDRYETTFGIRSFAFDVKEGFTLNGVPLKIRGVCLHSDLGALGMAFNKSAARRQLQIMKDMGVNGIRTSHNPAATGFLDLCDEMGFIVMSETFDVWKIHKSPFDYHLYWDDWHQRDFIDHIRRDRNHASLFVWCLGNEAQEQWHSEEYGREIPIRLAAIVDSMDGTRPTTIASNEMSKGNPVLMSKSVDLIGYNYNHRKWPTFLEDHPERKFIVTESTSALASRGQYDLLPIDSLRVWPERWDIPFDGGNSDKSISAYDHVHTPWGSTHEQSLCIFEDNPHISGLYVWTGFDYLGEPTPYTWPSRSSYFGIVDLAGFPKDVYYLYQSVWSDKPVLHVLPHWNWSAGDTVDVVSYYNQADEIELLLNGASLGKQHKDEGRLHVRWSVPFVPGVLTAVAYRNGIEVRRIEKYTSGRPVRLKVTTDREVLHLANRELAFLEIEALDEHGHEVPLFNDEIQIAIAGDGVVVATDNGNQTDLTLFQSLKRKAYNGKLLVVVKGTKAGGTVEVKASSGQLEDAIVKLSVD